MRITQLLMCLALAAAGATAQAQTYPSRPIRLIVPFTAGGPTDITARAVAEKMGALLKQPIVVENRTGAGPILAMDAVAKSPPDGYTLLFGTFSMAVSANLSTKLPYDTVEDFAPIGTVASSYLLLATPPGFPASNLKEFVAAVRANPSKYNYGSAGIGSGQHMAAELFHEKAKLTGVTHIPYRGASAAMPALLTGDVAYCFVGVDSAIAYVKAGKLRPIAVTSPKRDPALPDVPTVAESGFPGFEFGIWFVMEAPKDTPPAIVNKLNEALNQVLKTPELASMSERFAGMVVLGGSTPEGTKAFIRDEIARWAPIVKSSGMKPE